MTAPTDLLESLTNAARRGQRALHDAHGEIVRLTDLLAQARPAGSERVDVVAGPAQATLPELLRSARHASVWLRRPSPEPDLVTVFAGAARRPGLRLRALVDSAAGPMPEPAAGTGGLDVRVTSSRLPTNQPRRDTLLVDDLVAILPGPDDPEPQTVIVTQPVIAHVVQSLFDTLWTGAVPVRQAIRIQTVLGDEIKREIVRRLIDGDKDEAIARRMGISLRTCRRYIAEILSATDAGSRFQAGFRIALVAASTPDGSTPS